MSKFDVSRYAGAIFYVLENSNVLTVSEIMERMSLDKQKISFALGWLAYDNKVVVMKSEDDWHISLNRFPMTEIHY